MNLLNDIQHKFCINLDRRPDRWEAAQAEFAKNGIENVVRWSAVDGKTLTEKQPNITFSELGCSRSHINIMKHCVENNIQTALIFEDDVTFKPECVNSFNTYFKDVPDDWDIIYIGGNHRYHMPTQITSNIYQMHHTVAMQSYIMTWRAMETIAKLYDESVTLDVWVTHYQKARPCYCFIPTLTSQMVSYSDIQNYVADYNSVLI